MTRCKLLQFHRESHATSDGLDEQLEKFRKFVPKAERMEIFPGDFCAVS